MTAVFASTPMHILRTLQMKLYFPEYKEDVDLYLPFKNFSNFEIVTSNLRKTGLFRHVYVYHPEKWSGQRRGATFQLVMFPNEYRKRFREIDYQGITSFSITNVLVTLCYHEQRKKGIRVSYTGVEDNPSIMKMELPHKEKEKHLWCRIVGLETPFYNMERYYLSAADYYMDRIPNPVVPLPPVRFDDDKLKQAANEVFGYTEDRSLYDTDIILLEGNFLADRMYAHGSENKERMWFKKIKDRFPEKSILLKTHPRSPSNSFDSEIFPTMRNSHIPWQLYMLNMGAEHLKNKILISIISSALQSNKLLYNCEMKCVCLAKCFQNDVINSDGSRWINDAQIAKYEYLKSLYEDQSRFLIPANETELYEGLDRLL